MFTVSKEEIEAMVTSVDYSEALTITAGEQEVREACTWGKTYGFRSVVGFPQYVGIAAKELAGSGVLNLLAVGFPGGGHTTHVKCVEAEEGLKNGATDLDMVMNLSAFKNKEYKKVAEDIKAVMEVAKPFNVPFKVIIEIGLLTEQEKVEASKLVADTGVDFIKTCTGFGPGRATIHDIALIKKTVGDRIAVKASGGVASIEDAIAFMRAGATVVALRKHLVDQLQAIDWPRKQ